MELVLALLPGLIQHALQITKTAMSDAETPEEKRAHYAAISRALEEANDLVQRAPLPPSGSGRARRNPGL